MMSCFSYQVKIDGTLHCTIFDIHHHIQFDWPKKKKMKGIYFVKDYFYHLQITLLTFYYYFIPF